MLSANFSIKKDPNKTVEVFEEGGDILSHQVAVPSALVGLTSLFGMGRGEPHCYNHLNCRNALTLPNKLTYKKIQGVQTALKFVYFLATLV
jgi:hypothetical protein